MATELMRCYPCDGDVGDYRTPAHNRPMRDLDHVFHALSHSRFRASQRLSDRDAHYLREKGLAVIMDHAQAFVAKRLAPAQPANDGRQTPWRGHPVFVAQHATACCCRGCLSKWHGIDRNRALTPGEQRHVLAALQRWLATQQQGER